MSSLFILSFCGGGAKGYIGSKFIQKLLTEANMDIKSLLGKADVITGTSIGSILACAYAVGKKTPQEVSNFFREKCPKIFTSNATKEGDRLSDLGKLSALNSANPFYDYGQTALKNILTEEFGAAQLNSLPYKIIIPTVKNNVDIKPQTLLSNIQNVKYFEGSTYSLVDACVASSAAYPFFPAHKINDIEYIDGTFYSNSGLLLAKAIGESIKPYHDEVILLEIGTGISYVRNGWLKNTLSDNTAVLKLANVLTASIGAGEGISDFIGHYTTSDIISSSSIPRNGFHYYKFQPDFEEYKKVNNITFSTEIDNSDAAWFDTLDLVVDSWYSRDSTKISFIIDKIKNAVK